MIFTATQYQLKTVSTGRLFEDEGWTLDDNQCARPSMLRPVYEKKQLNVREGGALGLYRYADWLPIKTMLIHPSELKPNHIFRIDFTKEEVERVLTEMW